MEFLHRVLMFVENYRFGRASGGTIRQSLIFAKRNGNNHPHPFQGLQGTPLHLREHA